MAEMNPFSVLPQAHKRTGATFTRSADEPPVGDTVMVRDAISNEIAETPVGTAIKPLRGEKEPLPEAGEVDLTQVLTISPDAPSAAALIPPQPGTADEAPQSDARVIIDFDGGTFGDPGTIPPDTHGAPGLNRVVSTLNNRVSFRERNGNFDADMTLDAFWNVFGDPIDTFDPKLFLDEVSDRYIAVVCGNARREDSSVLVAVSHTNDPQGDWSFGRIQVDPATMGDVWLDYPSVGFTEDKITICLNLFTRDTPSQFKGVAIFVVDKQAFLNAPHSFSFDQFVVTDQGGTICPAIVADPGVADQFLVSTWSGNFNGKGFLALYSITGSVAAGTTSFQRVGFLEVDQTWAFRGTGDIAPQKDSAAKINVGDARMHWVVQRQGRLTLAHTVFLPHSAANRAAVQWVDVSLDGTPAVAAHGLFGGSDEDHFYAYPSLAVNAQGDTLIGMAAFGETIFASGAYAFRPSGGSFDAPKIYAPGDSTYNLTFGSGRNRWGDYSATHVDPANGRNFWTLQEYAGPGQDVWSVRWGCIGVPAAAIN